MNPFITEVMNPFITEVMNPFIIKVMRPPTWGKTDFVPILALPCGGGGARRFRSDEPLHHQSDETSHQGLFGPFSSSVL
jgi:hypothetical protein